MRTFYIGTYENTELNFQVRKPEMIEHLLKCQKEGRCNPFLDVKFHNYAKRVFKLHGYTLKYPYIYLKTNFLQRTDGSPHMKGDK